MKIIKIENNLKETAQIAAEALQKGLVLAVPADTVYGFIADAGNEGAVKRLFRIKGRPLAKPLPFFVRSIGTAKELACISQKQEEELRKSWPGKTTFILKKKAVKLFGLDKKTIALRIPNHPFLLMVMSKIDFPLAQTSANLSGKKSCVSAEEISETFNDREEKPDIIFDGGAPAQGAPSRIIDLTENEPKILRQ